MSDTPETQPIICAGLRRVSLPGQVENYSLDAQDHEFDELEKKFNCRIPTEYRVSDEGFSGADPNRPSVKLVTKWLLEGKIQGVAFAHLDRFSRDMESGLTQMRIYRELDAQILVGHMGWFADERSFKTQFQIGLMFSEMQRDDIRMKTMAGTMQKIRAGIAHGKSPWGWRTVTAAELAYEAMREGKPAPRKPQNYRVIVPEEQVAYRLMEELALAGNGLRGICRELKLRGIKTRMGKEFNPTTLAKILQDDCYWTGDWYYNKSRTVKPKVHRKRGIERHRMKSTHKSRPRSEWVGPQELPGGPITTKERHEAVLEALRRNGKISEGRPAA
jgi:DNA invertase Pin-like site-specific DNA recombinase